jgi:hypothetical protein
MEEAPENGKESSHTAHVSGMNECTCAWACACVLCVCVCVCNFILVCFYEVELVWTISEEIIVLLVSLLDFSTDVFAV